MGRPTSTPTAFVRNAFPPSLTVGQAREILPMPSSACTDEALAVFLLLGVSAETVGDITPIFKSFWSSKNLFSKRFLVGCGAKPCKKTLLAVCGAKPCKKTLLAVREAEPRQKNAPCGARGKALRKNAPCGARGKALRKNAPCGARGRASHRSLAAREAEPRISLAPLSRTTLSCACKTTARKTIKK